MDEREQDWVREAIAEQEEHIKRVTSCTGQVGRAHAFRPHGAPSTRAVISRCVVCGVTETAGDYQAVRDVQHLQDAPGAPTSAV